MADQVLFQGVDGITSLITTPGLINLDFADVKSVMTGAGSALMGIGHGTGEDRAVEAAKSAISSPLLESSIDGAQGRAALDRRPDRPLAARGQRGRRSHHAGGAPRREHHLRRRRGRRARRRGPGHRRGRRASTSSRPSASESTSRFESRLSRLLEEPVRGGNHEDAAAVDPGRRRRRGPGRVHERERPGAGDGVVRCRGGPGHPGLPEELTDTTSVPARPALWGAGRFRARRRPSPASWPRASLPAPRSMSGSRLRSTVLVRRPAIAATTCTAQPRPRARRHRRDACERAGRERRRRPARRRRARRCPSRPIRLGARRGRAPTSGRTTSRSSGTSTPAVPGARWHFIGTLQTTAPTMSPPLADVVRDARRRARATERLARRAAASGPDDRCPDRGRSHRRTDRVCAPEEVAAIGRSWSRPGGAQAGWPDDHPAAHGARRGRPSRSSRSCVDSAIGPANDTLRCWNCPWGCRWITRSRWKKALRWSASERRCSVPECR